MPSRYLLLADGDSAPSPSPQAPRSPVTRHVNWAARHARTSMTRTALNKNNRKNRTNSMPAPITAPEWAPRPTGDDHPQRMNGFPAPRRLRLALLDDHDVVRRGTALHLGTDFRFQIVASHPSSDGFARALQKHRVDVAIVDITLAPGDLSGVALIEHLRERAPRSKLRRQPSPTCWLLASVGMWTNQSR